MPILNYNQWFAEVSNDPYADAFGTILHTYRAAPENTATLSDLNSTWAEDEYNIPLLGIDDENKHFLLFAARKVPRSAGGQASAYAGRVVAQYGDVGDGVAGLRFVVVPDGAFSRLTTAATPVNVATAGHVDAQIGNDADNADLLLPAANPADQDHTPVVARALVPVPYHAASLLLVSPMKPKELWETVGGHLRGHPEAPTYQPIVDFLRLAMTQADGDATISRAARPTLTLVPSFPTHHRIANPRTPRPCPSSPQRTMRALNFAVLLPAHPCVRWRTIWAFLHRKVQVLGAVGPSKGPGPPCH